MNEPLVQMTDALLGYRGQAVLRVDSLTVRNGRCLGIWGPNGSGKTTLLRTIAGLLPPVAGRVHRSPRLRIGYLPQLRSLDPAWPMSALDAASLVVSSRSLLGWVGRRRREIVARMEEMGIAQIANRPFARLSGGQQQRVLLAGILTLDPQVLLLDEPTEGLDAQSRHALLSRLSVLKKGGLSIVFITHDAQDLAGLADQVVHLLPAPTQGEPSLLRAEPERNEVGS